MRVLLVASALTIAGGSPMAKAVGAPEHGVLATFEGRVIDLASGWGGARACYSDDSGTRCYRTEAGMDNEEGQTVRPSASCSSALKLYASASFGGAVLSLSIRATALALSSFGFDNTTSSYKIGSCAASFYDVYPFTTQYPGSTGAGATASSMVSGWDNRISSVYIS